MLSNGNIDLTKYQRVLKNTDTLTREGRINKIIGMTVEATGLTCSIGDICKIFLPGETGVVLSEVVGISESTAFLMPYQEVDGIGYGCKVINTGKKLTVLASDQLIGLSLIHI